MEKPALTELVASTPGLAESPLRIGGEVWFTDLMVGVLLVRSDGTVETVSDRRGVGGIVPHADGGVVASGRSLVHLADDGTATEVCARPDGSTGFNDLLATPSGDVLAGVLRFRPISGDPPVPGDLMRLSAVGLHQVISGPAWPNGIAMASDGTVYLADFATGAILRIHADGGFEVFAKVDEGSADGLALDATDRLWVATGPAASLVAFAPDGTVDRRVRLAAQFVSNLALDPAGGPALVTVGGMPDGQGGLLSVDLGVRGQQVHLARVPLPGGKA